MTGANDVKDGFTRQKTSYAMRSSATARTADRLTNAANSLNRSGASVPTGTKITTVITTTISTNHDQH